VAKGLIAKARFIKDTPQPFCSIEENPIL